MFMVVIAHDGTRRGGEGRGRGERGRVGLDVCAGGNKRGAAGARRAIKAEPLGDGGRGREGSMGERTGGERWRVVQVEAASVSDLRVSS